MHQEREQVPKIGTNWVVWGWREGGSEHSLATATETASGAA